MPNKESGVKMRVNPGKPEILRKKPEDTRVSGRRDPMVAYELGTCAHCEADNRLLKYAGRTMCCTYACQRAAARLVASRKAAGRGSAGGLLCAGHACSSDSWGLLARRRGEN